MENEEEIKSSGNIVVPNNHDPDGLCPRNNIAPYNGNQVELQDFYIDDIEKKKAHENYFEYTSKIVDDDEDDDDDNRFRTPTSLDHKIPIITKCLRAPMKTRTTISTKRKSAVLRRLIFDEVDFETILIATIQEELHLPIKKSRKLDCEN